MASPLTSCPWGRGSRGSASPQAPSVSRARTPPCNSTCSIVRGRHWPQAVVASTIVTVEPAVKNTPFCLGVLLGSDDGMTQGRKWSADRGHFLVKLAPPLFANSAFQARLLAGGLCHCLHHPAMLPARCTSLVLRLAGCSPGAAAHATGG